MKNEIGLRVGPKVFTKRFEDEITADVVDNAFISGRLRGKIKGKTFYFYQSAARPTLFSTMLKGKVTDRAVAYSFGKRTFVQIIMAMSAFMWVVFSLAMLLLTGPIGLLGLLVVPAILTPCLYKKKAEVLLLETTLTHMCKAPAVPLGARREVKQQG